jgi:hypothetical protein
MKAMIAPHMWRAGLFSLLGATVALILWAASALMAAGGHGIDIGFALSFPYTEVLHRIHPGAPNTWLLQLVGSVQWPLYGLVIGLTWSKAARTPVCLAIVALHVLVVACCFLPQRFYESFW